MKKIKTNDIELAVVDQGKGVPLVLVHGFPLDHSMWQGQIEGLRGGCRVIAPDLRGFGRSGVTDGTVTMAQMADDLAAMLDVMEVSDPVVFCGLSMGGYVAWEFFQRYRARLRGLVLCDTRAICDTPEAAEGRRETAAKVVAEGPAALSQGMMPKLFAQGNLAEKAPLIEQTRRVMLNTSPQGIAAAARGMAERIDAGDLLPKIDCPTMVIVGEEDAISTVDEMRGIADSITNSHFVKIPDAGHMSPLEQPGAVNAAIREFLATFSA